MIIVAIPMRTKSEANSRDHWAAKARRVRMQRRSAFLRVLAARPKRGIPSTVCLTRIAPSRGLDGDNLQSALKAVRDGVADALGINDGSPDLTWNYSQRRGETYAVEITIVQD
jgi:hypothetical protein